jgi:hypothetical protein
VFGNPAPAGLFRLPGRLGPRTPGPAPGDRRALLDLVHGDRRYAGKYRRRIANMDHSCADPLAFYHELDCVAPARRMLTDLGIKNYALCRSNSEETNLP